MRVEADGRREGAAHGISTWLALIWVTEGNPPFQRGFGSVSACTREPRRGYSAFCRPPCAAACTRAISNSSASELARCCCITKDCQVVTAVA